MGLLDNLRRKLETKVPKVTPPQEGHTLAEILQDKKNAYLFGEFLKSKSEDALAERIGKSELGESDIGQLEKLRREFSEKMLEVDKIEEILTIENVVDFASNSKDFQSIANNLVGPEKAIASIKNKIRELSILDVGKFKKIVDSMRTYDDYKTGKYKKLEDSVEQYCKDQGIDSKVYLEALTTTNEEDREAAFKHLATKNLGMLKKAVNYIGGSFGAGNLEVLRASHEKMYEALGELRKAETNVGKALFGSLRGNVAMRNAMFAELNNERPVEKPKAGMKDAKSELTCTKDALQKAWNKEKEGVVYKKYGPADISGKEIFRSEFMKRQKELYKKKGETYDGYWAEFFSKLTEAFLGDKTNEAELEL